MYRDAIKEHAYQSAMNNLEDDYIPLDEFIAEQEKVEVFIYYLFTAHRNVFRMAGFMIAVSLLTCFVIPGG